MNKNIMKISFFVMLLLGIAIQMGAMTLHDAIANNDVTTLKKLIDQKSDVNSRDKNGLTPLYAAVLNKNIEMVKYLVENGADVNCIIEINGRTPLYRAVSDANIEIAKYLVTKGAAVNSKDKYGWTSLHVAVLNAHIDMVKYLVENGADVNSKNDDGKTPWYLAVAHNYIEIVQYLIGKGAVLPKIKILDNNLLDVYLLDAKKGSEYILNKNIHKNLVELKLSPLSLTSPISTEKNSSVSTNHFEINSTNIIEKFDNKLNSELNNRLSVHRIIKKEKEIIKNGNYPIGHGRSTKCNRFITDQAFLYLMDIFNLFSGNDKVIDKTCHYTQHYAFPGEKWMKKTTSTDFRQVTITVHDFRGFTINLPQSKVAALVQTGITSSKQFSYKRSTLQFGGNPLATRPGSSPLDYVFKNGNVDEKRGSVTIESLFKRLGKMVGKDLSKYYQKYKTAFELICKAGEKFEHGTLLLYEFTPKTLQEYVKVTHSSGGHINNEDSGILIKGERTTDPKKVLDTLINNPEDFDEPTEDYEYFWPLTDEVTANMHSDEVKTYAFHIGKHDEMLAKNIKHWIAKVFERIKADMAQDGIIKYDFMNKSKL